ncbi:carbohydrate kinase [Micromonospora sp. NPDC094482]|uniref:carbohydrate kinase family protein n=1 Tax=unclassified Micromonospora TaxID=2617518 RepID=UPI003323070D
MITVVGEALVDLIGVAPAPVTARPGGSPANVAVALARLGHPTTLLTQLGADEHGRMLLAHLRANDVRLDPRSVRDLARTSVARTVLDPAGQASYDFSVEWRSFAASGDDSVPVGSCLHTGSLAAVLAPGADDVSALLRQARGSATISFDPNCRPSLMGDRAQARRRIETLVGLSDVVKVSVEDLAWLHPGLAHEQAARSWLARGAGLVVVTLGERGAWACTGRYEVSVPAHPVTVVDTIGAGDAFTAGMLSALAGADLLGAERRSALAAADRATLAAVLEHAATVAARTCARRGADPPTRAELAASGSGEPSAAAPGTGC